jgi:hypothetical protein
VADLTGKSQIHLEVISPMAISKAEASSGPALSGAFLFRFGGLLDKSLRQSDFAIGYQSAQAWLRAGGLARHRNGVDGPAPAVQPSTRPTSEGEPDRRGRMRTPLSIRARLTLARLLLRVLLVVLIDRVRAKSRRRPR